MVGDIGAKLKGSVGLFLIVYRILIMRRSHLNAGLCLTGRAAWTRVDLKIFSTLYIPPLRPVPVRLRVLQQYQLDHALVEGKRLVPLNVSLDYLSDGNFAVIEFWSYTRMSEVLANLTLGLDSFAICVGLGSVDKSRWTWPVLALSFAAADAAGTALGGILGQGYPHLAVSIAFFAPIGVAAYGCLVLVAAAHIQAFAMSRAGMVLLPLLLSLDNVAAAALGRDGLMAAAVSSAFIVTAFMALAGCAAGAVLVGRWPALKQPLAGGAALLAALVMGIA